ncbi:hypothetical protein [Falsihalocynthiibacter arcticus]|nr:hypothetical protein [Falsihalocynthiibacter arcticus]
MHISMHLRLLLVFIALFGTVGCKPLTTGNLAQTYVSDGLAYRQQIQLMKNGTYRHAVFQSMGNSVSTREGKWRVERNGGDTRVLLEGFKSVATHRDFAVHRVWGVKFQEMVFNTRRGIFGTLIITSATDPPVEYFSVK